MTKKKSKPRRHEYVHPYPRVNPVNRARLLREGWLVDLSQYADEFGFVGVDNPPVPLAATRRVWALLESWLSIDEAWHEGPVDAAKEGLGGIVDALAMLRLALSRETEPAYGYAIPFVVGRTGQGGGKKEPDAPAGWRLYELLGVCAGDGEARLCWTIMFPEEDGCAIGERTP